MLMWHFGGYAFRARQADAETRPTLMHRRARRAFCECIQVDALDRDNPAKP